MHAPHQPRGSRFIVYDELPDSAAVSDIARSFNPYDGRLLADPQPLFERMRQDEPIFYSPLLDMWVVSRHADICAVVRDPTRFSSRDAFAGGAALTPEAQALLATGHAQTRTPIDSDPPEHNRLRRIVGSALTTKKVDALRPMIRAIAAGLIDGFAAAGRVDLVSAFALPLPLRVLLTVLGVPAEDMARIKRWTDDWFALLFARVPAGQQIEYVRSFLEFQRYCEALLVEREREPGDDALSDMLRAGRDESTPLSMAELISVIGGAFIAAGHETTSRMLTNTLRVLLTTPGVWSELAADRSRIRGHLEEALRIDGTVPGMVRTATEDVVVAGRSLPAGTRLYLLYASGSRDGARFHCPAQFDAARPDVMDHLAFGRGAHYCVGAQLARAQAQIALDLLAERLPGLRLAPDQDLTYCSHTTIRGPAAMWIEWDPA
jgi:cytochrome P450